MEKIKVGFFATQSTITAIEHLRIIGPLSHSNIKLLTGYKDKNEIINIIKEAQLIIVQRDFPLNFSIFNNIVNLSRLHRKPLVYDIDDNLFVLPENHPDRKSFAFVNALLPMFYAILAADYVTVPNKKLQQSLSVLNNIIYVLPNLLDDNIWSINDPKQQKRKNVIIGYMGGNTHKPDLELVKSPLMKIKNEFPDLIRFHFYGIQPPKQLLSYTDTIWTPIKTYQYSDFAEDFQQIDVDFFIAPLIENDFNRNKSAIKFLEYSSVGAPGIFSNVYPYNETITNGQNGLLASSIEEWEAQIRSLIQNPDLRYKLTKNAQKLVTDKYLMSKNSELWEETYREIIDRGIIDQKPNGDSTEIIGSMINQQQEYYVNLNEAIADKKRYIEYLQKDIFNLEQDIKYIKGEIDTKENEILSYALSKSWNLTRPFRKINNFFKGNHND